MTAKNNITQDASFKSAFLNEIGLSRRNDEIQVPVNVLTGFIDSLGAISTAASGYEVNVYAKSSLELPFKIKGLAQGNGKVFAFYQDVACTQLVQVGDASTFVTGGTYYEQVINSWPVGANYIGVFGRLADSPVPKIYHCGFLPNSATVIGDSITDGANWKQSLENLTGISITKNGQGNATFVPQTHLWEPTDEEWTKMGLASDQNGDPILYDSSYGALEGQQRYWFFGREPGDSIYERADGLVEKDSEIIIVWGGQNDGLQTTGNIDDPIYEGDWVLPTETAPSYVSSVKGALKKLSVNNPYAKIYVMTTMFNGQTELTSSQIADYRTHRNLMKQLADFAGAEFIDNLECGINPYNSSKFYLDTKHPNQLGGLRLARLIAKNLY